MGKGPVYARRDPFETNHVLHLLLTVFSCGLWLPAWVVISWNNRRLRRLRAGLSLD